MYFKDFVGKICDTIRGMEVGSEDLTMTFTDGSAVHMEHYQNCCESVQIADVIGDPEDLLGVPMVMCEEAESGPYEPQPGYESYTDVWYKFRTHKGDVTIRWHGESNGYYGERAVVSFTHPQK